MYIYIQINGSHTAIATPLVSSFDFPTYEFPFVRDLRASHVLLPDTGFLVGLHGFTAAYWYEMALITDVSCGVEAGFETP